MKSLQWLNVASCSAKRMLSGQNKQGERDTLDMALGKANRYILDKLELQIQEGKL